MIEEKIGKLIEISAQFGGAFLKVKSKTIGTKVTAWVRSLKTELGEELDDDRLELALVKAKVQSWDQD